MIEVLSRDMRSDQKFHMEHDATKTVQVSMTSTEWQRLHAQW